MEDIIEYSVKSIHFKDKSITRNIIFDVNFTIKHNESLALIGESGSGKTMIALSIMNLVPQNLMVDGIIKYEGINVNDKNYKFMRNLLGSRIVYIPQNGHEFLNPSLKIKSQIYDTLKKNKIENKDEYINTLLQRVGFSNPDDILNKYPHEISGGMAQKITFVMASCSNPSLIIADEPTNGLDSNAVNSVMSLINNLFPQSSKLIITHDISLAKNSDRVLVINNGVVLEKGKSSEVLNNPQSPYTMALIHSLVENGMNSISCNDNESHYCPFSKGCNKYHEACNNKLLHYNDGEHEWWCHND